MITKLSHATLFVKIQQKALEELHRMTTGGSPIWPM